MGNSFAGILTEKIPLDITFIAIGVFAILQLVLLRCMDADEMSELKANE